MTRDEIERSLQLQDFQLGIHTVVALFKLGIQEMEQVFGRRDTSSVLFVLSLISTLGIQEIWVWGSIWTEITDFGGSTEIRK